MAVDPHLAELGELFEVLASDERGVVRPGVMLDLLPHAAQAQVHERLASASGLDLVGVDDRDKDRLKACVEGDHGEMVALAADDTSGNALSRTRRLTKAGVAYGGAVSADMDSWDVFCAVCAIDGGRVAIARLTPHCHATCARHT